MFGIWSGFYYEKRKIALDRLSAPSPGRVKASSMSFNVGSIAFNRNDIGELASETECTPVATSLTEAASYPSNRRI